jgi:hypothetical protein
VLDEKNFSTPPGPVSGPDDCAATVTPLSLGAAEGQRRLLSLGNSFNTKHSKAEVSAGKAFGEHPTPLGCDCNSTWTPFHFAVT